ncbi:unnamed protein product [Caenorhabditis bovis]|uniref:Uncharacterized protein n=1 Tax=Caenorhabditis bovis TaxID=2654633 RepID=A0A8S1EMH3_9PELO|nr:unnamed protein product [Caenorhabditis bovis]
MPELIHTLLQLHYEQFLVAQFDDPDYLRVFLSPQMSTPDDPVIHSPPPIGSAGLNGYPAGIKMEEPTSGSCTSPEDANMDPSSEESRRRQKTCRVCGDHATGYNFNVITCESCKAFFRRNALRPKEFKCPYSEDCEINPISRRFCQKCRLRKCFTVGMKKEWILNEEQLRRRKNSRLNNQSNSKRVQHHQSQHPPAQQNHPSVAVYRPLSINPLENQMLHHIQNRQNVMPQLMSPPGPPQPYSLTSPVGSTSSESPPSRNLTMMYVDRSPEGYDPNMMSHRVQAPIMQTPEVKFDADGKVVLSAEEYKQLLAKIPPGAINSGDDEPHTKRTAYAQQLPPSNQHTPPYSAPMSDMTLSRNNSTSSGSDNLYHGTNGNQTYFDLASFGMGMATATGDGDAAEEMYRQMNRFCDNIIQSALESPENVAPTIDHHQPMTPLPKSDVLSANELKVLDTVREAFGGMDEQMEEGRQLASFLRKEKTPADIMNIMDVTMRRFVKVAKCIQTFRDISQEGKFSLLKGGMIEMLTIRGVCRYDAATNSFKTPTIKGVDVSINVDEMFAKLNANAQAQKQKCLEFFRFFDEEIKKNDLAVNLVMLIVLFSIRHDPPMSERDVTLISNERQKYMSLLGRYLESLYGNGAKRIFDRVPRALAMLNDIARNAGMLFMGTVRNGEAEELPKEFFRIE